MRVARRLQLIHPRLYNDSEDGDENVNVQLDNDRDNSADAAKDGYVKADDNIGTDSEDGIDKCAKAFTVKQ